MIRTGCDYASWHGTFYPKGLRATRWREHYASVFDAVEVNSTFYRLAEREAVALGEPDSAGALLRGEGVTLSHPCQALKEFGHPSWFCDEVYALMCQHAVALAIGDHPDDQFVSHELTADFTYVRFHHGRRGARWELLRLRASAMGRADRRLGRRRRLRLLQQATGRRSVHNALKLRRW